MTLAAETLDDQLTVTGGLNRRDLVGGHGSLAVAEEEHMHGRRFVTAIAIAFSLAACSAGAATQGPSTPAPATQSASPVPATFAPALPADCIISSPATAADPLPVVVEYPDLAAQDCAAEIVAGTMRIAALPAGAPACQYDVNGVTEVVYNDPTLVLCNLLALTATDAQPTDTPAPASGASTQKLGDVIQILCDGTACETVQIDKASFVKYYRDPSGFLNDTPARGDVYLQFHVIYRANGPNADYNMFDWAVYVNDTAVDDTSFVLNGPKPELEFKGRLPDGKAAAGWVVQEVPASGRVVIAYQPGLTDIFEVTVRSK